MNDFDDLDDNDDWLTQSMTDDDLPDDNFSAPVMKRISISHHVQKLLIVGVPALVVGLLFLLSPSQWMSHLSANLDGLRINSNLMDSLKITGQSFGPSEVVGILLVLLFFGVVSFVEERA